MTAAVALVAQRAIRAYRTKASLRRRHHDPRDQTALLLSGGGNLSFFHLGVIRVLGESGLLPRVISGASAGGMIAALIGTRSDAELRGLHDDELAFIGFSEAEPDEPYTAERFERELAEVIPDVTFAEAEEISGRALNISLAGVDGGGIVCGPLSTPRVLVRDAVRASCAVPTVFEPVVVNERRHGRTRPFRSGRAWVDGSIYADVPHELIKRRYGVQHTIVSLVNPMARPFAADPGKSEGRVRRVALGAAKQAALGWARLGRFTSATVPRAHGLFDTACRVIEQRYAGDLVVTPSQRFAALGKMMDQPTGNLVRCLTADGECRTRDRLDEVRALSGVRA